MRRQRPSAGPEAASASLFELPVSRGARLARVFVVLALDLLLAGAGVAMILAYVDARKQVSASELPAPADAGAVVEVEALPPQPVAARDAGAAAAEGEADRGREPGEREPAEPAQRERPRAPERSRAPERPSAAEPDPARKPEPEPDPAREPEPEPEPEPEQQPGDLEDPYADLPATEPGATADAGADMPSEVERLAARISLLVDRHQGQLQRCYERAAKLTTPADPLEGRVEVRFVVTPEGTARDVRVHSNDTGSRGLGDCLTGLVASWTFPAGAREPTEFLWPFVFRAPQ